MDKWHNHFHNDFLNFTARKLLPLCLTTVGSCSSKQAFDLCCKSKPDFYTTPSKNKHPGKPILFSVTTSQWNEDDRKTLPRRD